MWIRNYLFASFAFAGGCSVLLDTNPHQCDKAEECGLFQDQPIYACESHFCEPVSCTSDAECLERGAFVCDDEACAPAHCLSNDECTDEGTTCRDGRCVDPIFYCFDQEQPRTSSDPAVVQLTLLTYGDQQPVQDLAVRVCSIVDLACNSPIKVDTSYDDKGLLSIHGLENGTRYSIRMSGNGSDGTPLLDAEYFMQRPVVGLSPEADKLEMVPEYLVDVLAASAGTTWDREAGLVLAETFGCDMKPLAGVSLADNRNAKLFYLTGVADANAVETDSSGVGGLVNMEVDSEGNALQHKLTFSYKGHTMFSFTVAPRPHVLTFVQIYLADYQTTIDRSDAPPR